MDHHNPLVVAIPSHFPQQQDYPSELVALRFLAWRAVVRDLVQYFRQYASVQEEIIRQQVRLQQAAALAPSPGVVGRLHHAKDADANALFLPLGNGLVMDVQQALSKYHQNNIASSTRTLKQISQVIVPQLEDLRKDLLVKIKEIKNLQNDFKNSLGKEVAETKTLLAQFGHASDVAHRYETLTPEHHDGEVDGAKSDPYLVRLRLERQLKRQLSEETYLYEAFRNLQTSAAKLELIVVTEVQSHVRLFLELVELEKLLFGSFLQPTLTQGFLAKEPEFEWDSFVARNLPHQLQLGHSLGRFIDLLFPARRLLDLAIPNYDSLVNVPVREGPLERRSKFLKLYSAGWFVLTCLYIHEFKTSDRRKEPMPVMLLSLDQCSVAEHLKNDGKAKGAYKFVLYLKLQNGLIHRGHNWLFRCDTYAAMIDWFNDIKALTLLALPSARAKAMSKKLSAQQKMLRTSSVMLPEKDRREEKDAALALKEALLPRPSHSLARLRPASTTYLALSANGHHLLYLRDYPQLPKMLNLINSDGTIVTLMDIHEPARDAKERDYAHYQYILNQLLPQQFYDPVLQQVFTLNAVPALLVPVDSLPRRLQALQEQGLSMVPVASASGTDTLRPHTLPYPADETLTFTPREEQGKPRPQYFPSSPRPSAAPPAAGSPEEKMTFQVHLDDPLVEHASEQASKLSVRD